MRIQLSYAQVEQALASIHRIAPDKRVAFKARLKHLQRLGFPPGSNTGTGTRAVYGVTIYLQMVLALELTQTGISPVRIVRIIEGSWDALKPDLRFCVASIAQVATVVPPLAPEDTQILWLFRPEALKDLTEDGETKFDYMHSISSVKLSDLAKALIEDHPWAPDVGEARRTLVLQAGPLVRLAIGELMNQNASIQGDAVYMDIADELDREATEMTRSIENGRRSIAEFRGRAMSSPIKPQ